MTLRHVLGCCVISVSVAGVFIACGDSEPDPGGDAGPQANPDAGPAADPAALVRTTLASQVGVVLDELPETLRDRAALQLMDQDEAAWIDRARNQALLTTYRLVFRDFYYDESEGKGQLPLPPLELWDIEIQGEPRRELVGSHDVVLVDYELTSTLFTTFDSPGAAEPMLAEVGGAWEEPFILPVDPELLFQRTGYACMDEAEFPPNGVDGENVATFYDHECEAGENECHLTEAPDEDCLEALDRAVGSVETAVRFERIAWDADLADSVRVGEVSNPDGAELEVIGEGLENHRLIYRYIGADSCAVAEGCVGGTGWRRLLQFDASVRNIGAAALEIGDVDYYLEGTETSLGARNIYVFSECHQHYHFGHYGDFRFGTGEQQTGNKQAFCLQSTNRYSNNEASPLTHAYGSCAFQGIQAGWGDDYGAGLDCQWVDVTTFEVDQAAVEGDLQFTVNPDQFLCEGEPILDEDGDPTFEPSDFTTEDGLQVDRPACEFAPNWEQNNVASRPVTMPAMGGLITGPCTRGQLGPLRDCGFTESAGELQTAACPVGGSITLRCTAQDEDAPAIVRVCEYSQLLGTGVACVYRDALENAVVAGGATEIEIECPEARDAMELGGTVSLYSAPLLTGDAVELDCAVQ